MYRQSLLKLLREHQPIDDHEQAMTQATIAFVEQHPNCFERSLQIGHVTGSAWVTSPDGQYVVLMHHRKLDRWLQPGGHADGDPDIAAVALREAQEETGLTSLQIASPTIYDVDVHLIPARGSEPAHYHYDIRFWITANTNESFGVSVERKDIRWIYINNLEEYTDEKSVLRMKNKQKIE